MKGYILYDEMNAFEPAPLTTGGLPVMREEEVELKADTDGIHFYSQKGKTKQGELFIGAARGHCQVVLTNLRLLAIAPTADGGRVGWGINLADVLKAEATKCISQILHGSYLVAPA